MGRADYKRAEMKSWDEMAPRYHRRWAGARTGPFQSTARLVRDAGIRRGDSVLDVACGTGAVVREIAKKVGKTGSIVGIDASAGALRIAARGAAPNAGFAVCDAERFALARRFDAVTCQYALFFFPSAQRALRNMGRHLRESGRLGVAVHGDDTPFYTSFLEPASRFVPDRGRPGGPKLDRFGTKRALAAEVKRAGFARVRVKEYVFRYSPGTFEAYWRRYTRNAPGPLREALAGLGRTQRRELRAEVESRTARYTRGGTITFPWQVLILTAVNR